MKKHFIHAILCLLSLSMAFGIPQSAAMATTITPLFYIVSGSLDKRSIQHVVRLHKSEMRHCYTRSLLKDKTLKGSVITQFIVLPDGSVEKALIKNSTLNNPDLEQCLIDHIENWKFYAVAHSDTKTVVEYPFTFASNYKPTKVLEHTQVILNDDEMTIEYFDSLPETDNQ